mgnify:CR=1 FL=1
MPGLPHVEKEWSCIGFITPALLYRADRAGLLSKECCSMGAMLYRSAGLTVVLPAAQP